MSARALARQYAHALFDVAEKNGQIDRVRRDVTAFAALVSSHDELARAFSSPAVSADQKKAVIGALIAASGGVAVELERLLAFLADRDRLMHISGIAGAFVERAMDADRTARADVTTAMPLGEQARAELISALGKAVNRTVTITERVDPSIIGGMVARIGGVVFDGSVTRQIERLREQLLARG
jgi:F-type H+-transporting ATPase subunit delta